MSMLLAALSIAIATAVMQSSLDRAGVGRVEETATSAGSNALVLLSIPLTLLSNLGVIAIVIWSFFVLPWLTTLGVVAAAFIGFSLVWGLFLARLRRGEKWLAVCAAGIPLVFSLRLICAACIVFLGVSYSSGTL